MKQLVLECINTYIIRMNVSECMKRKLKPHSSSINRLHYLCSRFNFIEQLIVHIRYMQIVSIFCSVTDLQITFFSTFLSVSTVIEYNCEIIESSIEYEYATKCMTMNKLVLHSYKQILHIQIYPNNIQIRNRM